jgi:starch synthase
MPDSAPPLRILVASAEVVGFAKTGGLADVCGSLPRALARRGHDVAVFLPLYRTARRSKVRIEPTQHTLAIPMGTKTMPGRLWRATLPDSQVPVWLVDQPEYFDRDAPEIGRGLYHYTMPGGQKRDYPDNAERYAFFARAILEAMPLIGFRPDVVHANDWQAGLLPVYLTETYRRRGHFPYDGIRSLFTIHNIAYQGNFPADQALPASGLDPRLYNHRQLEFYGQFSFLKAGVVFADRVSTVSPSYAQEIQTPFFGCGMQGILSERRNVLSGIVNGIDTREWDPAADRHLPANYDAEHVEPGKPACKAALQREFHLDVDPRAPLLGMIARLVEQKGVDLVVHAAEGLIHEGVQFVILGEGDPWYQNQLMHLRDRFPSRVGLTVGFNEPLAHRIEGGADIFLMPSLYEPSGLNQLYSLRYGTVPVVKATGGLADTITDVTPGALTAGTATGFRFRAHTPSVFQETVLRAVETYRTDPEAWLRLMQTGMRQDWSWDRSAAAYEALFREMVT